MDHPQDLLFTDVPIHFEERGGWVRFFTDPEFFSAPRLSVYLAGTLHLWFQQRPEFHLRCVLPFAKGGDTVELMAWYDLHVFPASGQKRPQASLQ